MELVYASKLLAKTLDEIDEKVIHANEALEDVKSAHIEIKELVTATDNKIEVMPLVLASSLEKLIEKRTSEAFEDVRTALDELRNKLWAIKKQIKDSNTGAHQAPTPQQLAEIEQRIAKKEKDEDGISVRRGGFLVHLPFSEGTLKVLKYIGVALVSLIGSGAAAGGIWALIERIKHLITGG